MPVFWLLKFIFSFIYSVFFISFSYYSDTNIKLSFQIRREFKNLLYGLEVMKKIQKSFNS